MNILFVCTSNKDRSPALEEYFTNNYPNHSFGSAGINKYFTSKKGTTYIDEIMLPAIDIIVYAESIHRTRLHEIFESEESPVKLRYVSDKILGVIAKGDEDGTRHDIKEIVLALGNYQQGCIAEDYLMRAEQILKPYLK